MPHPPLPLRNRLFQLAALLALMLSWSMAATAQVTLLAADFNDKALNQPIGNGGAAVGEPALLNNILDAVVRTDVMPGKSLAITRSTGDEAAARIRFRWLDEEEVSSGIVSISMLFTPGPDSETRYSVLLREFDTSARSFGGLLLATAAGGGDERIATIQDATASTTIEDFTWTEGQTLLLEWVYDMDAGTYDFSINGTRHFEARPHGVTPDGRGLGSMMIGFAGPSALDSRIDVDDILVTRLPPDESIFINGFEAEAPPAQ